MQNETSTENLNALRANAHVCSACGMLADVDPFFHQERYGHAPRYRDETGMGTVHFLTGRQSALETNG